MFSSCHENLFRLQFNCFTKHNFTINLSLLFYCIFIVSECSLLVFNQKKNVFWQLCYMISFLKSLHTVTFSPGSMGDIITPFAICYDWTVLLTDSAKGPVPWAGVHWRGEWRSAHSDSVPQWRHQAQIQRSLLHPSGLCRGGLRLWWATQHRCIDHHFPTRCFSNHTSTSHVFSRFF